MRFTIVINQDAVYNNGWIGIIKANHLAVLSVITAWIGSPKAQKISDKNGEWYLVRNSLVVGELPMFEISEERCRQLIRDLCSVGLLERHPDNSSKRIPYLRKGENYLLLEFSGEESAGKKLPAIQKNYQQNGENDENAGKKLPSQGGKKLPDSNNSNSISKNTNTGVASQPADPPPLLFSDPEPDSDPKYTEFNRWLEKNASRVLKMTEPVTAAQYHRLQEDFAKHKEELVDVLRSMHNTKDLLKKYVSANLTIRNWIKRRIDDRAKGKAPAARIVGTPVEQPRIKLR